MVEMRDKFLSEEDLDLKNLTEEELYAWWDVWLEWAQATNDLDEHTYSHGVFTTEPPWDASSFAKATEDRALRSSEGAKGGPNGPCDREAES